MSSRIVKTLLKSSSVNRLCTSQSRKKATLPSLAFEYKDLEPIISRDIIEVHHQKHHNTYVVNYNNTLEKLQTAVTKDDVATIIGLAPALKFNGGGHINHSIFWETLTPHSTKPSGKLLVIELRTHFMFVKKSFDVKQPKLHKITSMFIQIH